MAECPFTVLGECLAAAEGFAPCASGTECNYEGFQPVEGQGDDGPEHGS